MRPRKASGRSLFGALNGCFDRFLAVSVTSPVSNGTGSDKAKPGAASCADAGRNAETGKAWRVQTGSLLSCQAAESDFQYVPTLEHYLTGGPGLNRSTTRFAESSDDNRSQNRSLLMRNAISERFILSITQFWPRRDAFQFLHKLSHPIMAKARPFSSRTAIIHEF